MNWVKKIYLRCVRDYLVIIVESCSGQRGDLIGKWVLECSIFNRNRDLRSKLGLILKIKIKLGKVFILVLEYFLEDFVKNIVFW